MSSSNENEKKDRKNKNKNKNSNLNKRNSEKKEQAAQWGLKCLYSNTDQLLNKIEDLKTIIAKDNPDIMLFTEVIPKAQKNEIYETQMKILGYETHCNFKFTEKNLGASGMRGVAIYIKDDIKSDEVTIKMTTMINYGYGLN